MRIQKNWTNYYEICRSAVHSQSERAWEDLMFDFGGFINDYLTDANKQEILTDPLLTPGEIKFIKGHTSDTQIQLMLNDPLLDQRVKNFIHAVNAYRAMFGIDPDYNGLPPSLKDFLQ